MTLAASLRARLHRAASHVSRHDIPWASAVATMAVSAALTGMLVDATAQVRANGGLAARVATVLPAAQLMSGPRPVTLRWEGADIDGDGADDFVNPTGKQTRREDEYGYGHFGASRDGGTRDHKGVDYMADAGQPVKAPISGYVTRIGQAYASNPELKYVEIRNPALRYEARVFYVDPDVRVGASLHLGDVIGTMHTLQDKYGPGMTNHVHLELSGPDGVKFDATRVLTAHVEVLPYG